MSILQSATLPLNDRYGRERGRLELSRLTSDPNGVPPSLQEIDQEASPSALAAVQLLEDSEYRYALTIGDISGALRTDRPDMFSPDDGSGRTGRLRTRSYVGLLPVTVLVGDEEIGAARMEVRSRKLDYLTHYRWMLRDLTEIAVAILLERFAPSQLRFKPDELLDPTTAYERFALVQSLLGDPVLQAAFGRIVRRPHVEWLEEEEIRNPGRGIPAKSNSIRQLIKPGPRESWSTA